MAVKFDQHIDIDATPDAVWSLLTDPGKWPLWFTELEHVTGVTDVRSGTNFSWQHGEESGTGTILNVDPDKDVIVFATRQGSDEHKHTFDIDRSGGFLGLGGNDSRVRYTYEYDPPGGMLAAFVAGDNPIDTRRVKNTLRKIKELAESMGK